MPVSNYHVDTHQNIPNIQDADKESWEPTLERLFYRNGVRTCLREAWSLDWQDSGDSAVLNTEMLRTTDKGASECPHAS